MFNPKIHDRRSIRKRGYDYSGSGYYFVTICVQCARCVLGEIMDYEIHLTTAGEVVRDCLLSIPSAFPSAHLDTFVIMPNHIHSIIVMDRENQAVGPTLGKIVRYFKAKSSSLIHKSGHGFEWQRNYYEHIIRQERSLNIIRLYIATNSLFWDYDAENRCAAFTENTEVKICAVSGIAKEDYDLIRNYVEYRKTRGTR